MGEEMGLTRLQILLRSLCYKTEWKYAVFWKLNQRTRMVLTWEDVYFDINEPHDPSNHVPFQNTLKNWHDGCYTQDPLSLAVAKMSYLIYSLGEGIIGQVAVTGNHQWIFADKLSSYSWSSSEYCAGWQSQFSAGIRSIAVVAVIPHGVVQLGSLTMVNEDMKLVTRIKDVFSFPQNCSMGFVANPLKYSKQSCYNMSEVSSQNPSLDFFTDSPWSPDWSTINKQSDTRSCLSPSFGYNKIQDIYNEFGIDNSRLPLDLLDYGINGSLKFDSVVHLQNEELQSPKQLEIEHDSSKQKVKANMDLSHIDAASSSLTFSAGCELYKVLGSMFKKEQSNCTFRQSEETEGFPASNTTDRMVNSCFTRESGSGYLLDAVVANAHCKSSTVRSENSLCKSAESLLTTGRSTEIHYLDKHRGSFSGKSLVHSSTFVNHGICHHLKSIVDSREASVVMSSTESSLKTPSKHSEQSGLQSGPAKINRKRARPGESCRPRPRDRQLIQDRVKELRELVPNGSKCSIVSLLERTIKHMLFLQSVTKHADKKKKSAESKFHDSAGRRRSCNNECGSTWAVDVMSQEEACPIVVENLKMNGQMLVEMREDCCHFLEIAESIRNLGLTIIKGVTTLHGDKTWASFIVEGQNTKTMHRMDILWSLMQLLQPKTTL